jgi:predicted transcriptional regulator
MSNKRVVKRTVPKNGIATTATVEIKILQLIKMGEHYPSDLVKSLNMNKQTLNYHLNKLKSSGLIANYSKGIYDITNSGKKILATYENNQNKTFIQLENMRYKADIYKGFEAVMERIRNPKKTTLNSGVTQYDGKIGSISIRVFHSKKSSSIEFCCQKWVGENRYEIMYDARKEIETIAVSFSAINGVHLGILEQSMKPEWAIPHPFAEMMLKITNSSQIRTRNGVVNRSAGRNADWETDDIVMTGKILNMPNDIAEMKNTLDNIQNKLENKLTSKSNSKDYQMYG